MAKYKLRKRFTFEAAHRLPNHDGNCQRLHGHSFVGWLIVEGDSLVVDGAKADMLVDYGDISGAVKQLVSQFLDHHYLNETTGLENPTCEKLAWWIYQQVHPQLPLLAAVIVEETCSAACEYRPVPEGDLPVRLVT